MQLIPVAAIGPLLIWYVNVHRITPDIVITGVVILAGGLVALQVLATALFRRPDVSGLVLVLGTIALLYDTLIGIRLVPGGIWLWGLAFASLIIVCVVNSKAAAAVGRLMTIFLPMLCVMLLGGVAINSVWGERAAIREALAANYPPIQLPAVKPASTPDIYYIIFDRYARADILARHYGYDNSEFLSQLRMRGFAVAEDAYGAYQRTAHSLVSTLNLGYIDTHGAGQGSSDWVPLFETLGSPRLFTFLKGLGYQVETYGAWWEPTRTSPLADRNDAYFAVPESLRPFTERALLASVLKVSGIGFLDPRQRHCQRVHYQFDAVSSAPSSGKPRFAFAHFLMPHPPFVLDATGRCTSVEEAAKRSRAENYIDQLRFTNAQALAMVDAIMSRTPDAVIVLQSDEGPWPARYAGEEVENFGADISSVEWRGVPAGELQEKMAILSAIRMPGADAAAMERGFAPVNTFRILLREVFGVTMPDLERRAFVFHNDGALYDFSPALPILLDPELR